MKIGNMKNGFVLFIFVLLLISFSSHPVLCDLGPKPSVNFYVTLNGEDIPDTIFYAKILSCQIYKEIIIGGRKIVQASDTTPKDLIPQLNVSIYDPEKNCSWKPSGLAWGGKCRNGKCHFNYMIPSRFRLAVYLPSEDKVYISDEIKRRNFRSTFKADLLPNGSITVKEITPFFQRDSVKEAMMFLFALVITLVLELFIALLYVVYTRTTRKILGSVFIANIISLPVVWLIITSSEKGLFIIIGEVFAVVFESFFIYFLNKEILTLRKAFLLSMLMNLTSFIVGNSILMHTIFIFYS